MKKISLILTIVLLLGLANVYAGTEENYMKEVEPYIEVYGYPTCTDRKFDGFLIGWHREGNDFMHIVEFKYNSESGIFEDVETYEENCVTLCYLQTEEELKERWERLLQHIEGIVNSSSI